MRTRAVAVRAVAVALAVAAAAWVLPRFGAVFVGGGSMAPALARGDLVVVRRDVSGVRSGEDGMAKRVLTAATELDFRPNPAAQSLRRPVSTVGVIVPDLANRISPRC